MAKKKKNQQQQQQQQQQQHKIFRNSAVELLNRGGLAGWL
jgi:hypothetical protein